MNSLLRKQFVNLIWDASENWDAADLVRAARCWLAIHQAYARQQRLDYRAELTTELRLTGFPRYAAEDLRVELERRAASNRSTRFAVGLGDPDTLTVSLGAVGVDQTPFVGQLLSLVSGHLFECSAVEVRFSLVDPQKLKVRRRGKIPSVLSVVGQFQHERLSIRAIMREFPDGSNEPLTVQRVSSKDEETLQTILREFREHERVSAQSLDRLFKSRPMVDIPRWIRWLILVPFDRPRFVGLLLRLIVYVALFSCCGLVLFGDVAPLLKLILTFPLAALGGIGAVAFAMFLVIECLIIRQFFAVRKSVTTYYRESSQLAALKPADSAELSTDPRVRKYTAECLGAGFSHAGDLAIVPVAEAKVVIRVFLAADRSTYVNLVCTRVPLGSDSKQQLRLWPMQIVFRAQTLFPGGGRIDSVSPCLYSYWRPKVDRDSLIRIAPPVTDLLELVRSHAAVSESIAKEGGLTPLPHKRFDDYLRFQESFREEERQHYLDYPHSVVDLFRWYLQWPRQEYRG